MKETDKKYGECEECTRRETQVLRRREVERTLRAEREE
jgi:hypothetical protein